MIRLLFVAAISGGVCLLAGCEHAENFRWASGAEPAILGAASQPTGSHFPNWNTPSVAVYSYAAPAAAATADQVASTKLSVKDLSDRGQAALVEALTKAGADAKTIMAALSTRGASDSADGSGARATVEESYSRTLVATVSKGVDAGPGDRLVWTWIDIRPLNFDFTGYTVVATDNETLQIEQVQNQTTASLQGQAGQTSSDTGAHTATNTGLSNAITKVLGNSLGATATLSKQYTTSATINQQYVKLSADVTPDELRIYHESERNLDVAGNTIVALTLKVAPEKWHPPTIPIYVQRVTKLNLADVATGALLAPATVTMEAALNEAPPNCPLFADVTLLYKMRHIIRNARSYIEGEQQVEFWKNSVITQRVELVPADEVRKPSWSVFGTGDTPRANPVMLVGNGERPLPLDFTSFEQATSFALWLSQNAAWFSTDPHRKIGKAGLALGSRTDNLLPPGPFFADRYHNQAMSVVDPAKAATAMTTQCAGMEKDEAIQRKRAVE